MPTWGSAVHDGTNWGRLGYDFNMYPSSVSHSTESVDVRLRVWFESKYSVYDSSNSFSLNGTLGWGANKSVDISHGSSGGTTLIYDERITVTLYYSGTRSTSFNASLSGINAISGTMKVNGQFTVPKRPATQPSRPGRPEAYNLKSRETDVRWDVPSDNGGASITGYQLQISTQSDMSPVWKDRSPNTNTWWYNGLTPGKRYYMRVRAENSAGSSVWSYIGDFTAPAEPPKQITDQRFYVIEQDQLGVDWSNPGTNGTSVTNYQVQLADNSSFSGATTETTTNSYFRFYNLKPGTRYWARVRANSSAGYGDWSSTINSYTLYPAKVRVSGSWRDAKAWVRVSGTWRESQAQVRAGGSWRTW